jgi:7-cyano-7-deazaguanine synthase
MTMSKGMVVLLSGGQDSATCLMWALSQGVPVRALSIDYGQRHSRELLAAKAIAKMNAVEHKVIELTALNQLGGSALVDPNVPLQREGGFADSRSPGGLPTSYVPGRNILFFALAAAHAVHTGCDTIVTGVCQADEAGYPDCRAEFVAAMQDVITTGYPSGMPIKIEAPLLHVSKADTVRMMREFGVDAWATLAETVTCYNGLRPGCGECGACLERARGFAIAGLPDPAQS